MPKITSIRPPDRWAFRANMAAVLIALPLAQAVAQTTMVENIDEPGRNPYQEFVANISVKLGSAFQLFFQQVPSGKRRVITHANCRVKTSVQFSVYDVSLSPAINFQVENLPVLSTRNAGNSAVAIYGSSPQLYIEAGDSPVIEVSTNDGGPLIQCRLSGYDISLPPPSPPAGQ